jgi:hypothetical protein
MKLGEKRVATGALVDDCPITKADMDGCRSRDEQHLGDPSVAVPGNWRLRLKDGCVLWAVIKVWVRLERVRVFAVKTGGVDDAARLIYCGGPCSRRLGTL